ncbi:midasin isoform X2 [Bradysia coprophila]|uniref:midasin isoform X2 n=1 Tax=Bradysia coprophila TaxID=38358 RepID=UPI00187DAD78|nr:midasin isoform X2 [Bradysia coprophila]
MFCFSISRVYCDWNVLLHPNSVNKSCLNIVRESFVIHSVAMEKAVAFNIENDYGQILYSLEKLHQSAAPSETKRFEKVLRLWEKRELDFEKLVTFLSDVIVKQTYTNPIKSLFSNRLFLIVTKRFSLAVKVNDQEQLQEESICLSKLIDHSVHISNHAVKYFKLNAAPFGSAAIEESRPKLKKRDRRPTQLDVVKCCYYFLKDNFNFYKNAWKWSDFLRTYANNDCDLQKLYTNHIMAMLIGMSVHQLKELNCAIPRQLILENEMKIHPITEDKPSAESASTTLVPSTYRSDVVCCIEGVFLPIYDVANKQFYHKNDVERIVDVASTKANMRSIALGISSNKAICLTGPVGCGKTTLVEHLAKLTGRIAPISFGNEFDATVSSEKTSTPGESTKSTLKRTKDADNRSDSKPTKPTRVKSNNGFLRIQLGDQTDSKMLLGQYRCTDLPGEFIWQAGVLTQAVISGQWLLLEDIDCATQDVATVLTNLMENRYLSVPGFRDCVRIAPGFQLFVTLRSQKLANHSQHSNFQILEKYLYNVNMLPLSRSELSAIISINYPKLATIADRIVDVYLEFSKGMHQDNASPMDDAMDVTISTPSETVSTAGMSNSNRLVSTRDLFKLCKRSHPTFSVTSTECAYNVFQNAVDLFCSYLAHDTDKTQSVARIDTKTQLIVNIGAKLGVNQSRCEFYANEHRPEVVITSTDIKCGRVRVDRRLNWLTEKHVDSKRSSNGTEKNVPQKKKKIDEGAYVNQYLESKNKDPTFSFTRLALCILEKIAVAVTHNEPVLLVGETGVGKTSSVQYLAHQTKHKLVVVNMNNQSDVSDLIGGYKPVDLEFVVRPMRTEFEFLFKKTFNISKNQKFLNNLSIQFNGSNFTMIIKLMLKVCETVFDKKTDMDQSMKSKALLTRWSSLRIKLLKLNSQLKNSINISFAFIPGSLVNCIKNGDWILLDELNLASTETLECLSTILEPDGSIVLLEKGDYVPIERHSDFRIFACMNPSTDIGKKDLPIGIRNRFTEFYLDELTTESDLQILIGDYLTTIRKPKVFAIVKLYRELRKLAKLKLNDGLGNRPVYSLRTLCRALSICAKDLCGSVERNLYESFCVGFLTQLDQASHEVVRSEIQDKLLSNVKAILNQEIKKPENGDYINFEGYWIPVGRRDVLECENYILTASVKQNLKDLARIISIGRLPVLLQGPTSAGKTSLIDYVAKRSGNFCLRINNHEHTDLQEYIGTYTSDVDGKLSFKEGVLVQAMRKGYWIILDELNLAPSDILEALNRVLDDNRELYIPETQTLVKAHPNFMLFATQNPPGLYGGRKTLSRAFKNRFIELHFSEIPKSELEVILEKRCLIPKTYAQKMVKTMSELQINRERTTKGSFTLRDLFRWGNRYTFADRKLLEDNRYDWNQHLVDEGFLVLSSKIRNDVEVEIIKKSLFNHFRKEINLNNLFTLHDGTSMVTKHILEKIVNHPNFGNIIWTFNMNRMAVLVAKCIEFSEPVLLVGPTGCGKTTICQILADVNETELKILNCHMHTEGADFLGGLRPFRSDDNQNKMVEKKQLFEWVNGPLVTSMIDGTYFLADEISLAEDSVLERLNCILEPERTLLLSEKGGANESIISDSNDTSSEFVITAKPSFKFFATMNPGGDFGKKELSPALRNRFTEIWCRPTDNEDDLIKIAAHTLRENFKSLPDPSLNEMVDGVANVIVKTVFYLKKSVDKLNFSIRDILAWVEFIAANSPKALNVHESLYYGLETLFLDSLEMLPHDSFSEIQNIRAKTTNNLMVHIKHQLQKSITSEDIYATRGSLIETKDLTFGINPFFIPINANAPQKNTDFMFTAPTTQQNLFRLLSALSLNKAILLEGPPGVGKTSLIENLTTSIGYDIVRINLCEHTDLADLFGTDLPAENKDFTNQTESNDSSLGSFIWRDGPLLSALKAENTWILLDELNLAPQSVLEGLNAILDHRGEAFIPELNKTFKLGRKTRIFASQNPLRQGGGRKGLPQSFLNRFTKVYLRKLATIDLLHVVNGKYEWYFESLAKYFDVDLDRNGADEQDSLFNNRSAQCEGRLKFDLAKRLVSFSEQLDDGITNMEFGHKGGPFEVNLRDILRWCELLTNRKTGFLMSEQSITLENSFADFMLVLYEKMKLVYYVRMRTDIDKAFIRRKFAEVFNCDVDRLEGSSADVSLFWNDNTVYMNDIEIPKASSDELMVPRTSSPLLLPSQLEIVKSLAECVINKKPIILCGSADCGKTKTVDVLCTILNRNCVVDTIDDSVTGSFQQVDLYRHLEEAAKNIESILIVKLQEFALAPSPQNNKTFLELLDLWESYVLSLEHTEVTLSSATSAELLVFKKRQMHLEKLVECLSSLHTDSSENQTDGLNSYGTRLQDLGNKLKALRSIVENTVTLNTGGHFEWVDSKIVKALKFGQFICLEHVNLCSSAVLDRLNSVFEPNGSLLISEKGVSVDNEPDVVTKHENFCAFLTLDPKSGEISRAMRNRCIEININKENYNADDLKRLIYTNGVKDTCLIDCLLKIHRRVSAVSDFNAFGVAHILKCSFLIAENKRQGHSNADALKDSTVEVYVRSSSIDLLGFGLDFYRNKLESEIMDEIATMAPITNVINYDNIILKTSELGTFSLIQWQCEVLLTLARCHQQKIDPNDILPNEFSGFAQLPMDASVEKLCYMLLVVYDISSADDVEHRKTFLELSLSAIFGSDATAQSTTLRKLNNQLYHSIAGSQSVKKLQNKNVPWNSKMFPRLRSYKIEKLSTSEQLKITAELITKIVSKEIVTKDSIKLNQIDVLTYSKAVQAGSIQDSLRNDCITFIHPLLASTAQFIQNSLTNSSEVTYEMFSQLICSFLWTDRMQRMSHQQLFKNKKLNENVLDKLILHFGWLQKHLVNPLKQSADDTAASAAFEKAFGKISMYIQSNCHPLNQVRKEYVKKFTNFMPYYDEHQVSLHECVREFSNLTSLVAHLGRFGKDDIIRKIKILFNESTAQMREFLTECSSDGLEWLDSGVVAQVLDNESNDVPIAEIIRDKKEKFFGNLNDSSDIDTVALRKLNDFLPVAEYFAMKSLVPVLFNQISKCSVNTEFFNRINTINVDLLQQLKAIKSDKYTECETNWNELMLQLKDAYDSPAGSDLPAIMSAFTNNFYKNYSSFNRKMISQLRSFSMNSICVQSDLLHNREMDATVERHAYDGPTLTVSILNALLDDRGHFKSTGLGEAHIWRSTLSMLSKVVWFNINICDSHFSVVDGNLAASLNNATKLLVELHWIKDKFLSENPEFFDEFLTIIKLLDDKVSKCRTIDSGPTNANLRSDQLYYSSMLNVLIGSIEINLMSFMPIIDPVEKNRLKKVYNEEDEHHITQLLSVYDAFKIITNYRGLNEEMLVHLRSKVAQIEGRKQKFSKKVALRPNECMYGDLVRDVNHFLTTCCHPKILNGLVVSVDEALAYKLDNETAHQHLQTVDEIVKKIDLWINNAQQFMHHQLNKYSAYYRDFLTPIESSLTTLRFGFVGLQSCLIRSRDSICLKSNGTYSDINENGRLTPLFGHLIEFPSVNGIDVLPPKSGSPMQTSNIINVLNQLPNYEECYFMLVKSKLHEIRNRIEISGDVSLDSFSKYDSVLNICNMIWMEQEELKRKKLAEEESLYVHKTHCETEDEEEVILSEIEKMFPTDVDNDFGEFIQSNTLEKIIKKAVPKKSNKSLDILSMEDMKLLCKSFVDITNKFSRSYYYNPKLSGNKGKMVLDFISPFKINSFVFNQLLNKYRSCLDNKMDEIFYGGVGLIIAISQQNYDFLQLTEKPDRPYDFYKDSNISEIVGSTEVLSKIEIRTNDELNLWPDHAVLIDMIRIIERIRSLPITSSVVRFSTGFQLLRQKLDEWNKLAHKNNHMKGLEIEVAQHIQRWTKLELQFWRECLTQSFERMEDKGCKYWFFVYNLIHEYLREPKDQFASCDLTDIKSVEKCFGSDDVATDVEVKPQKRLKSNDVVAVLKQFIESSNFAEFSLRMSLLKSFELYLHHIDAPTKRRDNLIKILHSLHLYYDQFRIAIVERIKAIRAPIEKKLKELVKIESYNKDLSYFSMRNNIARVHRNLHKFLKEFEKNLDEKIVAVFQLKELNFSMDNEKDKKQNDDTYTNACNVDVKCFIASSKLLEKIHIDESADLDARLVTKVPRLFGTSRNIVKEVILQSQFPMLISNLDLLLIDQIESCEHLRKLEVDRSQIKTKQKVQAKQILSQKRKALSDVYKVLSQLGLNFRTGLMENSLREEIIDLKIQPFCVRSMILDPKHRQINQHLMDTIDNLDLYYAKCVFKLKLLQTVLLTPHADLGLQHLERIKGFSIDLYLLVQSQRNDVSDMVKRVYDLQQQITKISELSRCVDNGLEQKESTNFVHLKSTCLFIKESLVKICNVFHQYVILLKSVPSEKDPNCQLFDDRAPFNQLSESYLRIKEGSLKILDKSAQLLLDVEQSTAIAFHNSATVGLLEGRFNEILLTVFVELGSKGFCIPPDLMEDEDGESKQNEGKRGEGFGLDDGTGENDVSDKIESEDQLDTAKKPGDEKESKDEEDADCKEERGIDMSEDFDSKLQDVDKKGDDSDESEESDNDDEPDKQMGETEEGAERLDNQIWGSDEEEEPNEDELNEDENGKGSKDDTDAHNDMDANENDENQQGDEKHDGLDAADNEEDKKKQQKKDIDKLDEPDVGDDQINPYHNELEDPPEPDDMDLGENFNLDNEDGNDKEENPEENPFDIDTMKENMEVTEEETNEEEAEPGDTKTENDQDGDSDSESETEDGVKKTSEECEDAENSEHEDEEPSTETPGKTDDTEKDEEQVGDEKEDKPNETSDYNESKDKASREENVQATPDEKSKGSSDQVQIETAEKEQKQDDEMDAQDTGEDKQGTGQAENEDSKSGHQGYSDSKETKSKEKQQKEKKFQEKRKHGNTNEERTVSDTQKEDKKQLKTIDKLNEKEGHDDGEEEKESEEVDEYQHIKDAKKTDKTTYDNATEEQSKQVHHEENAEDESTGQDEGKEDLMEVDEEEEKMEVNADEIQSESTDRKSNKPSKERNNEEQCETKEVNEVEGEAVQTHSALRSDDTSAHCIAEILQDASIPAEPSALDTLELRRMVNQELYNPKLVLPGHEDFEIWQTISNKMLPNARELCEQLRLILEPTKCTRLKGDYRTGRRINMKKIIPYIASQFRKDKIWLRRTKPAQRDYKISIAIDDSKSMHHNNSKDLTLMAISLVSQALKFLESGKLSIVSFGEEPKIVLNHTEQFDGPKLVNSLNFDQNQSRIGELLDFVRIASAEDAGGSSDNGIFENLLLVLSDGRNIFSEGEQRVRNSVKLARLQRIFIVYVIIDNPENKRSILDIQVPKFSADRKSLTMNSYLDSFPFPYYVIVRDLSQLPLVLSDAMRQWFELVNSEQ